MADLIIQIPADPKQGFRLICACSKNHPHFDWRDWIRAYTHIWTEHKDAYTHTHKHTYILPIVWGRVKVGTRGFDVSQSLLCVSAARIDPPSICKCDRPGWFLNMYAFTSYHYLHFVYPSNPQKSAKSVCVAWLCLPPASQKSVSTRGKRKKSFDLQSPVYTQHLSVDNLELVSVADSLKSFFFTAWGDWMR